MLRREFCWVSTNNGFFWQLQKVPLMDCLDLCRWSPIQSRITTGCRAVIRSLKYNEQCWVMGLVKVCIGHLSEQQGYRVEMHGFGAFALSLMMDCTV